MTVREDEPLLMGIEGDRMGSSYLSVKGEDCSDGQENEERHSPLLARAGLGGD
jgi:hypothetical protein